MRGWTGTEAIGGGEVSAQCHNQACDVREFARKFQTWLTANGWYEGAAFGSVVWHKGTHHIAIDPDVDILATFAAAEGLTSDELQAKIAAT